MKGSQINFDVKPNALYEGLNQAMDFNVFMKFKQSFDLQLNICQYFPVFDAMLTGIQESEV